VCRRHCRVDTGLVHKNQPFWLDSPHVPSKSPPLVLHIRPGAFAGVQGLFLVGQTQAAEGAPNGGQAAPETTSLLQLVQGGVVLFVDQLPKPLLILRTQSRCRPTAVRLGSQHMGFTTSLKQPDDKRKTNAEPSGDLTLGAFPIVDRGRDSLAEIHRVGCHGSLLLLHCHSVSLRIHLPELSLSATRL
jgi:hypothetical protein